MKLKPRALPPAVAHLVLARPMRRYVVVVALSATAFLAVTIGGRAAEATEMAEDVSMVQLIATPEKFDGKFVRVFGFLNLAFEGDSLYLHREDLIQDLFRNGVWLDRTGGMTRDEKKLNGHYVLMEAIFDAQRHGHMGLFGGTLRNITRIETWPPAPMHFKDLTHRSPLLPDEKKLVGSWKLLSSTGDQWVETYEADHTYWVISYKGGKASLTSKGRWYIMEDNRLLVRNPGKTPPHEHGIMITDLSDNTLALANLTYTRCPRPKKPVE